MEKQISIDQFIQVIRRLPSDAPLDNTHAWYRTQKEHWLGWLGDYEGSGAYGRKTGVKRDAKYAYNHVVCPELLMYLIRAIPLKKDLIEAAEKPIKAGRARWKNQAQSARWSPGVKCIASYGAKKSPLLQNESG